MFAELSQLMHAANLAGVIIRLAPEAGGRVSVIVQAEKAQGEAPEPKLQQALGQALHVGGTVTELEQGFWPHLTSFCENHRALALVSNTDENFKKTQEATTGTAKTSASNAKADDKAKSTKPSTPDEALQSLLDEDEE